MGSGILPRAVSRRQLLILSTPPLLVLALTIAEYRTRVQALNLQHPEIVDAPATWVAFQAELTITRPGGPTAFGKYFRSSDGSHRIQTGPSHSDVRVISILNVSERMWYDYSARSGWTSYDYPNAVSKERPTPVRANLPGWNEYPFRLALKRGESGAVNADEGFRAYQVIDRNGTVTLKVPDLNLYSAVIQRPDGHHQALSNIDITEPSNETFRPPTNVAVTHGGQWKSPVPLDLVR